MNRTAKKLLAMATSAAIVFSVSFSAFAEQATPETVQYALSTAAAVQTQTVATLTVARSAEGSLTDKSQDYASLQDALNALASYQFDTTGDTEGETVYYEATVSLNQDVTGSFTVPAYTASRTDALPTLDLNGHTLTAADGPALTLEKNALLCLSDNGEVTDAGTIAGGSNCAIYAKETSQSTLWIFGGTYTSGSDAVIKVDTDVNAIVQACGGRYSSKLTDNLVAPGEYKQVQDGSYWKVEKTVTDGTQNAVAQDSEGTTYTSVQAAVDANKGSVTLLQDTTESIDTEKALTLDFNGHVLTAADGKDYAIRCAGSLRLSDKTGKGGTVGTILIPAGASDMSFIEGGTYRAKGNYLLDVGTNLQLTGGTFYGSGDYPVVCASANDAVVVFYEVKVYAGNNQPILYKSPDAAACHFVFVHYASSEQAVFYGDLGVTDPKCLELGGGRFDRKPPANCLNTADGPMKIVKDGGFWVVRADQDNYPASVTWNDGTTTRFGTLNAAMSTAVGRNEYCTVTLLKDVSENLYLYGSEDMNATVTLDLNGHTLTAADSTVPAITNNNVRLMLDGKTGATQAAGTVNGTIVSTSYLWIIHTTVNASEGQPAITNTQTDNDSVSVKGRSVINGAAGQPAIASNGRVTVGDDSTVKAGANGTLFAKGEQAAEDATCFVLDMSTLYGNLGDEATVKTIKVNASNGKCFTKFDRVPASAVIPAGFMAVKSGSLYELQPAPVNALVGDKEFQALQEAIDYAVANGGTPKMVKSMTEDVTIPAASTVTVDMAGCTLTGSVTNNGKLNLNNGNVKGKITLGTDAALRFTNYNSLDNATLPDGYSLSTTQDADGYFQVVPYNTAVHSTVKNAVEQVNAYLAAINSAYKLETLTNEQINALAGKAYGDDNNPIVTQYNAIMALDQAALEQYLNSTRIGASNSVAVSNLKYLYKTATMKVETDKQEVSAAVDTGKTEAPAVDEKVPEEKKPTKEQAVAKVESVKSELTQKVSNEVSNFKDNNLNNAVKIKDLEGVNKDSEIKLYVTAKLQDIQLGANVETDDKGEVTEVKLASKTLKFDVTPMVQVDGNEATQIGNDKLNGSQVVFRLPIPADVTDKYAVVSHVGDPDRYIEIQTDDDGKKYIEVSATHFSVFTVNFTNTLPTVSSGSETVTTPAETPAPAQKDDGKDVYYTCKACGHHDWTATADGYKCNHCGYVESVKQLAGYSNVKGVYEPKTSTAAAQKTAVKSAAIPQTSDDMPIAALTLVAIAALLGFGVTAVRKFHR